MVMTGDLGKLKVGYQHAGTFRAWTITRHLESLNDYEVTLTALLFKADPFWVTQRPLIVGLFMGKSWWVWSNSASKDSLVEKAIVTVKLLGNPVALSEF